ncbi:MAG: hypothetical protein GY803_27990 [Chloroflexi bacterium]|nr:hypothetical protein [Chloroflexota bacterium]
MKRFRQRLWVGLPLIGLAAILGVISWRALPRLVDALPGQIRHRLPPEWLALVQTPLPTALPAPPITTVPTYIPIPALPTPTVTATATITAVPTAQPTNQPTATPTTIPTATPSPTSLPAATQIEGLTVIPQKFNNCGSANLSLTLAFYGHEADQLDIAAVLKPNYDDRNVSPHELAAFVNEQTPLRADVYSGGDPDLLKRLIAAGFPVIVEKGLFPNEHEGWMGHYLTVYGYDDAAQEFISMDTFLGPWDGSGRADSYETMTEFWSHFNYLFLLVYPPERETAVQTILNPDIGDPTTMWRRAAQIAQTNINANPDNAFAWFNLGTNLTHLGELTDQPEFYANAAAAFDAARLIGLPRRMLWYQFEMYEAYLANGRYQDILTLVSAVEISEGGRNVEETFLYLGHAHLAADNTAAAQTAYARALDLNPNFTPARQALEQMGK